MTQHLKSFQYKGAQSGPHLLLTGAVHGNEVAGPIALKQLMSKLDDGSIVLKRGTLTIIPICNPRAHEQDVRFTTENLNRLIRRNDTPSSYEDIIAQEFIPYIDACDYMLDIHSTHMPDDLPFSFMDENHPRCVDFAKATGMQTLLVGWENVYEGEDFSTEAYANGIGKTALTLECGYHKGADAGTIAWNAVMNGMQFLDMIDGQTNTSSTAQDIYRFTDKVIAQDGDHFAKDWQHLSPVKKDEIIYYKSEKTPITAAQNGYILIPNHEATAGMELYYFGVDEKA
jgi:predicted deacylase